MNFFEAQAQARSSSRRLVLLFALAVAATVVAVDGALLLALGAAADSDTWVEQGALAFASEVSPALIAGAVLTVLVIGVATLYRVASLRSGGEAVARQLGASRVPEATRDPQLRRLRNVVEEIAIASSVPMPDVFVLEKEEAINAFAAGYTPSDAAITVTRGALERLNRDELQGVIAHEFSHVLNGDMRLNIRLMGVLFGLLVLGVCGRKVLEHTRGGGDSKGAGVFIAMALAIMVIGYVGLFFGRMIKAGVSRSREYLADASAVQFTRQNTGIAGALKKIAGLPAGSRLHAGETEEVSHMLFGDGVGYSSLFATHPPLFDRILKLDKTFRPEAFGTLARQWSKSPPNGLEEDVALGLTGESPRHLPGARTELRVTPEAVSAQVGAPAADDFARAGAIHESLPEGLHEAASTPSHALGVVLALLLDADAAVRARQLAEIAERIDEGTAEGALSRFEAVRGLHPMLRLPLAAIAFPLLRRRPRPELHRFLQTCDVLIRIDGHVGLFEYCLAQLLRRQVLEALDPSKYHAIGKRKLAQCRQEVADLFSVVAQHGHDDEAAARLAFDAGVARVLHEGAPAYAPPRPWIPALDAALAALDHVDATGKQLLVEGLVAAISQDSRVAVAEAELLRVVCAALHCPLPAMLEHARR